MDPADPPRAEESDGGGSQASSVGGTSVNRPTVTGMRLPNEAAFNLRSVGFYNDRNLESEGHEPEITEYFTKCEVYTTPSLCAAVGGVLTRTAVLMQGSKWLNKRLDKLMSASTDSVLTDTETSFQLMILCCRYIESVDPSADFTTLPRGAGALLQALNEKDLLITTNKMKMEKLPPFTGNHRDWPTWSSTVIQQMSIAGYKFIFDISVQPIDSLNNLAGMHIQTALAKGNAMWICTLVQAANDGKIMGTSVWKWLKTYYENEIALSKRIQALTPHVQGGHNTAKTQAVWFQSYMENFTQYQLVSAIRAKYGYAAPLSDDTSKALFVSASSQLADKTGYMSVKDAASFDEILKTFSEQLALDSSLNGQFATVKVRRVISSEEADNRRSSGGGKPAAVKWGSMPGPLFKRLNEKERGLFKDFGRLPNWYQKAARELDGDTRGLKDPQFPASGSESVGKEGDGADGMVAGDDFIDLSGRKKSKKGRRQDKKSSKKAKSQSILKRGGKKRGLASAGNGDSQSRKTRRIVVDLQSDNDVLSVSDSEDGLE